jgi:hypothetical protein
MAATQFLRPFVLAAVALVAWSLNPSPALMPPVFPMGDQLTYAPVDDPAVTLLEPVLHAPWLGTSPLPVRSIVATLVVLGASAVALLAGASLLATLFMALALVLDVSFGAAVSHVGGLAVAVGLIWLAATATFASEQPSWRGRRWFNPAVAIILWSLAIWWGLDCHPHLARRRSSAAAGAAASAARRVDRDLAGGWCSRLPGALCLDGERGA